MHPLNYSIKFGYHFYSHVQESSSHKCCLGPGCQAKLKSLKLSNQQIVAWRLGHYHYQLLLVIGVQGGKRNKEYFDGLILDAC